MSRLLLGVLVLLSAGCTRASETDARAYLKEQGIDVVKLTKQGDSFRFEGKKGNEVCEGTVTAVRTLTGSRRLYESSCKRDLSACKPGAAAECMKIADELYDKEAKVFPTAAADLYRTACADGTARACDRVAEYSQIDKKWPEVREFAKKACSLGEGDGCERLGRAELEGQGGPKDETRADALFSEGCNKSSMRACRAVAGRMLDKTPPDAKGALPISDRLCAAKYQDGCTLLGIALYYGKKDYPRAAELLEAGCKDDKAKIQGYACNMAGVIHAEGMGMKKEPERGLPLFEAACTVGSSQGCDNAGLFYARGRGAPRDPAKSKEYYAKACTLGQKTACGK